MTSTINTSSIAIAERYAREHFGLSLPITSDELKSAFRRMAKELHTDTSGDNGTKDKFIAMKSAYDFLAKLEGMKFVYGEKAEGTETIRLVTTDGAPLYELGLGLGPMKNGRDCERCNHTGYTEEKNFAGQHVCYNCDWNGRILDKIPCNPCNGTGKFTQARSGQVVRCRACHGWGEKLGYRTCPQCHGKKYFGAGKVFYVKCYACSGTGEIELFSPLFPKGRIINKVKAR
jgi:DnaJ-class molecular chaperone